MRSRATLLAYALATALVAGLVSASPAFASPLLQSSRTCAYYGENVKLTVTIPVACFPPWSPVWGRDASFGRGASSTATSIAVDLVAYRLGGGAWNRVSTTRISSNATTPTLAVVVRPGRGRYRYVATVRSWSGTASSNAAAFAVVGTNVVALTFDDGPWPTSTASILGTLANKDVRATFFMCGYTLAEHPSLGQPVVKGGHEVGNHTYTHPVLTGLSDAGVRSELTRTQDLVKQELGVTPKWCRPPYGATSDRVKSIIERAGMSQVIWNVDPLDWKRPGSSVIADRVVSNARPGYVVLMHDGGGDRSQTAAAVPSIIDRLRAKGYDFVTMSELAALKAGR